jgi:hypothetical protein
VAQVIDVRLARVEKDQWGYYAVICMLTNAVLMSGITRSRESAERWAIARGYSVTALTA